LLFTSLLLNFSSDPDWQSIGPELALYIVFGKVQHAAITFFFLGFQESANVSEATQEK